MSLSVKSEFGQDHRQKTATEQNSGSATGVPSGHQSNATSVQSGAGAKKRRQPKKKTSSGALAAGAKDAQSQADGAATALRDKEKEIQSLRAEIEKLKTPDFIRDGKQRLDVLRMQDDLVAADVSRSTPKFVALKTSPLSIGRIVDFMIPDHTIRPRMVIGNIKTDWLPAGVFVSTFHQRLLTSAIWMIVTNILALVITFDNSNAVKMCSTHVIESLIGSGIDSHAFEFSYMCWIENLVWSLPVLKRLDMLYAVITGGMSLPNFLFRYLFISPMFLIWNTVLLFVFWFLVVGLCRLLLIFTDYKFCRTMARMPLNLQNWLTAPAEKLKHLKLVAMKISDYKLLDDHRPEFDRTERLADSVLSSYHICVELRTDCGYRYYKDWDPEYVPAAFWKVNKRTLKECRLDAGLISSALNRKTLLATRADPALAVEAALRLMQANPHYQEDANYVVENGESMYRDMALVCGSIVCRSIYHDNQHF
jgi:hypothetical protein